MSLRSPRRLSRTGTLVVTLLLAGQGLLSGGAALAATPTGPTLNVDFGPASATPPAGYVSDSGQPYSATRGYGWVGGPASAPVDLSGNGRDRGTPADRRLATFMHMQLTTNTTNHTGSGRWEAALPSGSYAVTVAVGDGGKTAGAYCCLDSVHRLTVEGVLAVNNFQPTAAAPFFTTTVVVAVSDGRLTIDPAGGTNTKIDYVDVVPSSDPVQQPSPLVTGVSPASGATAVPLDTSVALDVSQPLDPSTVGPASVQVLGPTGQVTGSYNSDAAGGTANFTPSASLSPNTTYTIQTTSSLKALGGASFVAFSSTFTTGSSPPPLSPYAFTRTSTTTVAKPSVMVLGPDGELYVGTASGTIWRYHRAADGSLDTPESTTALAGRIVLGMAFDPADPTRLWVVNNYNAYNNAPRFSGRLSTLTVAPGQPLAAATTVTDRVVGLPRSAHDHMTNGIAFGPDGRLYIAQGANTAYGAPDTYWGTRGESPLSASVLVADVHAPTFPAVVDVNTDPVGTTEDTGSADAAGYAPTAPGAPVTVYAAGVRNPYALVWASNGKLYAPVNESAAGGKTPAGPAGSPPSATNVQAYSDYVTSIDPGAYYGHPNPSQGFYTLNGGNPTATGDPDEVVEYPVGVAPDPQWRRPDLLVGLHRSPDGAVEYTSRTAFGGALTGTLLVTEYSSGDDLVAVNLDAAGHAVSESAVPDALSPGQALRFSNPLALAADPVSGVVYVSEYGDDTSATSGQISVLTPGAVTPVAPSGTVKINFQPGTAPVPAGYTADSGAPFNGTTGWKDATGAALDLRSNTRDRNSPLAPDQRYDTFIHMQAPSGSGVTTPGTWYYALPAGQYDVHVVVGDPKDTNSSHTINAESGTPGATTLISGFVPKAGALFGDATKRVTVSDGFLTLDAAGGRNTKLDVVEITPVAAGSAPSGTTAPVAQAVSLPGSQTAAPAASIALTAPTAPPAPPVLAGTAGGAAPSVTPDGVSGPVRVQGQDEATLGLQHPRLVYSTYLSRTVPDRSVTLTNTGTKAATVTLALSGPDASSYTLPGATSLSLAPGQVVQVPVRFTPTAPTGCPTTTNNNPVSDIERYATLTVTRAGSPGSTVDLAGVNACDVEGGNEPVLAQVVRTLGYTTKVVPGTTDIRFLGPARSIATSDEVQAPYFRRADASRPVTVVPVAHYSSRTVTTGTFGNTGWFAKGTLPPTPCPPSICSKLFGFDSDQAKPGPYVQNQKLLPTPNGVTTFSPTTSFGLYNGDGRGINATDDAVNYAARNDGTPILPTHYLHDARVYPAYGPGHQRIPGTWIIATDSTRVPSSHNNDYQDVVLLLRNATLDTPVAATPGAATTRDLTAGGTVSSTCAVTGFSGVLPNGAGTQCDPSHIAFGSSGLTLTASPGQMGGSTNDQQDALYRSFDASRSPFTVQARVVGPVSRLTSNYQQVAAFFGPDQDNYVKVEAEHNGAGGAGGDPHITMFFEEAGTGGTVQTVSVPGLTSCSTLDLVIMGNTSVPDPTPSTDDPDGVRRYPLDEVTVGYRLDGGAVVPVGSVQMPKDVMRWFSTSARAGLLVSGGGSTTPFQATFSSFAITPG